MAYVGRRGLFGCLGFIPNTFGLGGFPLRRPSIVLAPQFYKSLYFLTARRKEAHFPYVDGNDSNDKYLYT